MGDLFWDYKDCLTISLPGLCIPAGLRPSRMERSAKVWELLLGNEKATERSPESFQGC